MKTLKLPRPYLSNSQVELWLRDPEKYVLHYFHDMKVMHESPALLYGKSLATHLENGTFGDDADMKRVLKQFKKYDVRDQAMYATLKTKKGVIPLMGKPDTFSTKTLAFREYKSGTYKWDQKRAQEHPQLLFYNVLIYLNHNQISKDIWLDWIQTEEVVNFDDLTSKMKSVGNVQSFEVTHTLRDVLEHMSLISKVAFQISARYEKHLSTQSTQSIA